ncbi:DUF2069 domain-containing protein [Wenzhouxiangella marina]|uniref:DUF2069 domain-containing protein n=1 Tax=Wenzhouxiangella marina TaxID=1579979 RepID=UPI000673BF04|nr:DUF2069 domain-containing protein [Wenzhouxiangella marina]MBB6087676.1 putative membrane protein [Wenzhouxiangella marina]
MISLSWCRWSLLGLVLLQPLWFAWWSPPSSVPVWLVLGLALLPLLLVLPGSWRLNGRSLVIAGCLLMGYFCIGVMEAWASPAARWPALLQVLLCLLFFTGLATIRRVRASSD